MEKKPTKRHKAWTWAPTKPSGVPRLVKNDLIARAQAYVDLELKPKHVKPPPGDPNFNYLVDILTKWHGRFLYFVSKYACPGPNALSPFLELAFTRLECQRNGRFSLACMRHTEQWWRVYTGLTVDEALQTIREETLFQP